MFDNLIPVIGLAAAACVLGDRTKLGVIVTTEFRHVGKRRLDRLDGFTFIFIVAVVFQFLVTRRALVVGDSQQRGSSSLVIDVACAAANHFRGFFQLVVRWSRMACLALCIGGVG